MFLKSMEIFGFKSFADRIQLEFEPGITAIVGPNGCGKSNIVDAVKWVLGEKQAKNIRGERMEDIIFSGTEQRKQLSLSEVSLTIDNSDRVLEIDSDSITVTRRVFRDGESEYLINKSPVRLKDIEKLFLDTGIGKSAYSVLEQGRMDLILSSSAEDRRYIFEEAAGISRYKLQKRESLKKLTETGANIERINDVIREIEREKDLKSKQAEKTREYLSFKSRLMDLDVKINIIKYREILKRRDKIQSDIERLRKERESISARVSSISSENEKDEKRKNDIQHQLFDLEKKLHGYKIRVDDIDDKTDKNRDFIKEQQSRINATEKKIKERSETRTRLISEKDKAEVSRVDIGRKIEDDREKLKGFFESRKRKIDSIHKSRERIEDDKRRIKDSEGKLKKYRDELEDVIRKLIDAIERKKAELSGSESERLEVRERINERMISMESLLSRAVSQIESGHVDEASASLGAMDLRGLREDIDKFEKFEDGFRAILFDKTGIYAEKEGLDNKIGAEVRSVEELRSDIAATEEHIQNEQKGLEDINEMITRVEKDLSRNENESNWIEKHIQSLFVQIKDVEKQIENHIEDTRRSEEIIGNLSKEIEEWEHKLVEFSEKSQSLMKSISEFTEKRREIDECIVSRKSMSRKDEDELGRLVERIGNLDKSQVELIFKKNGIEEYLWLEYEKKVSDFSDIRVNDAQQADIQEGIQKIKKEIQDLGPINNLAIEEYKDLKKRFEYYIGQKKDIEKARTDILSVIEDINRTSVEMFTDTFKDIQKNFSEIFRRLFEGGEAAIELADEENVLESGIEIMVRPPGKKPKNINLLSGGERALTAIALLFATYMTKSSPFCFLDEIDAPLDEQNIGRFVKMLKEFARGTQFVIVTHNKKTMSICESIYGVTMEEPGISKVVSLKLERRDPRGAAVV